MEELATRETTGELGHEEARRGTSEGAQAVVDERATRALGRVLTDIADRPGGARPQTLVFSQALLLPSRQGTRVAGRDGKRER